MSGLHERHAAEYDRGFEDVRAALLTGLEPADEAAPAGSYLMGAFVATVQVAWENRLPGTQALTMIAALCAVLGDVIHACSGRDAEDDAQRLSAVVIGALQAASLRDSRRAPLIDPLAALKALASAAGEVLTALPASNGQRDMHERLFARYLRERLSDGRPSAMRGVLPPPVRA